MLDVRIKKRLAEFTLQISFHIKSTEIVALYGHSGSGKTTTLHSIAGLVKLDDGQIKLNDRLLTENGKSLVPVESRQIGYVFQDYALFPHRTVWENIAYGMKNEPYTKKLIDRLHIKHLLERYPHEISGGEKQRTAFIRALASEPELLLLDEPFSALDDETKLLSYAELRTVQRENNIPTLLVTHSKQDINYIADRVLVIRDGMIKDEYDVIR